MVTRFAELAEEEQYTLATANLDQPVTVHTVIDHWGSGGQLFLLEAMDGVSEFDGTGAPLSIVHGTDAPTVPMTITKRYGKPASKQIFICRCLVIVSSRP